MEDWEKEDFEPAASSLLKEKLKKQWDDEDIEEEDVKDSWEDEDEDEDEDEAEEKKPQPPVKEKYGENLNKAYTKKVETKVDAVNSDVLADPVAEKLRRQRIEEEADFKATRELFGKKSDEKCLEYFIPKSENDFIEYAELVSHKLRPYETSFHYVGLLKAVMRLSMATMKAADAKEVASSITAIANEKIKAEKEVNAGKKKQGIRKKQLLVDRPDDDAVVGGYDALDDYDFM